MPSFHKRLVLLGTRRVQNVENNPRDSSYSSLAKFLRHRHDTCDSCSEIGYIFLFLRTRVICQCKFSFSRIFNSTRITGSTRFFLRCDRNSNPKTTGLPSYLIYLCQKCQDDNDSLIPLRDCVLLVSPRLPARVQIIHISVSRFMHVYS